jgi:hypothetical protein
MKLSFVAFVGLMAVVETTHGFATPLSSMRTQSTSSTTTLEMNGNFDEEDRRTFLTKVSHKYSCVLRQTTNATCFEINFWQKQDLFIHKDETNVIDFVCLSWSS